MDGNEKKNHSGESPLRFTVLACEPSKSHKAPGGSRRVQIGLG